MKANIKEGMWIILVAMLLGLVVGLVLASGLAASMGVEVGGAAILLLGGVLIVALVISYAIWVGVFLLFVRFLKTNTLMSVIGSYLVINLIRSISAGVLGLGTLGLGVVVIFIANIIVSKYKLTRYP